MSGLLTIDLAAGYDLAVRAGIRIIGNIGVGGTTAVVIRRVVEFVVIRLV